MSKIVPIFAVCQPLVDDLSAIILWFYHQGDTGELTEGQKKLLDRIISDESF